MELRVENKPLTGRIVAPIAKSPAHRYLIASALSSKEIRINLSEKENNRGELLLGSDLLVTIASLKELGFNFQRREDSLIVANEKLLKEEEAKLNCRQSGTSLRLLLPLIGALGLEAEIIGEGKLPQRPIGHLIEVLKAKGMEFDRDKLPLKAAGQLQAGDFFLPGDVSSQYFSGLLMALPLLHGDSRVFYTSPLQSKGYVDLTIAVLKEFSIRVELIDQGFYLPGKQSYLGPGSIYLPGDWSGSAFYLAAGGFNEIVLDGLKENSNQSDEFILEALRCWGAKVETSPNKIKISPSQRLALNLDLRQFPDLAPILALMAALSSGQSCLKGLHRLRYKESDRLQGIIKMLQAFKVEFNYNENSDTLKIWGQPCLNGGVLDGQNDHRLIMTGMIAATCAQEPITIINAQGVEKSYPMFFNDYQKLGGSYYVLRNGEES